MPKFGGKLMDEDIWKVVSYIRCEQAKSAGISLDIFIASSKEKSAPYMGGDPQVGEKLFFSEEIVCGKCHTLGGKGGSGIAAGLGPDLTYVVVPVRHSLSWTFRHPKLISCLKTSRQS